MANDRHVVTFRFRMPHALARHGPLGAWSGAPRGCTVDVYESGHVLVTSRDRLESFAKRQVVETAALFLRAIGAAPARDGRGPQAFEGELSAPSCRARPEIHAIAVGAAVAIARTDPHRGPTHILGPEPPVPEPPVQLELINLASA